MSDDTLASDRYDLDAVPSQSARHYCERHDLFKVKDAMGDRICPACAVECGKRHARSKGLSSTSP